MGTIEYLADRPQHLPTLAEWLHAQWGSLTPGSALAERVAEEARALGVAELYLFTPDQERLDQRLGRRRLREERYRGWDVTVMVRELTGP